MNTKMQIKILEPNLTSSKSSKLEKADSYEPGIIYNLLSWLESFRETAHLKKKFTWTTFSLIVLFILTITLYKYKFNFFIIIMIALTLFTTAFIPYKSRYIRINLIQDYFCAMCLWCIVYLSYQNMYMGQDTFAYIKEASYSFARNNYIREYFINNVGAIYLIVLLMVSTGIISIFLYIKNKAFARCCNFLQAYIFSFINIYISTALVTYVCLFLLGALGIMNHNSSDSNELLLLTLPIGIAYFIRKEAEEKIKRSMKLFEHKWTDYSTKFSLILILLYMCISVVIITLGNSPHTFLSKITRSQVRTTEEIQVLNIEMLFCISIMFLVHLLTVEYMMDKKRIGEPVKEKI